MGDTSQTIDSWVEFVNSQSTYHKRQIERLSRRAENGKPELKRQQANHKRIADQLDDLASFLKSGDFSPAEQNSSARGVVSSSLHFVPEDLEGLPPELMDQLNISESDELELQIFEAIEKAGGSLPVDKILIQIYRDTEKVLQRDKLASKLYRMASKGRLIASSEHRGVYSLPDAERPILGVENFQDLTSITPSVTEDNEN